MIVFNSILFEVKKLILHVIIDKHNCEEHLSYHYIKGSIIDELNMRRKRS